MKSFKKNKHSKQEKILNKIAWQRYLNARSMQDQTLAKQIAEEYGIDYDCFPILEKDTFDKIHLEIENAKRYQREKEIKEVVECVLKENRLITQ